MPSTPGIIAKSIWQGAVVERSVLGTADPEAIWAQVREAWPEVVDCFAFEAGVGVTLGVVLADGRRAALKVHRRLDEDTLRAVQEALRRLHDAEFPCPPPLGVRGRTTLEAWIDRGEYRDAHEPPVRAAMAALLARLHALTRPFDDLALAPCFERRNLWPTPHNVLFDFEATAAGAAWIDETAAAAAGVLAARPGREVVGHGDWSVKHIRFDGLAPTVVYDWDSLCRDHEAVLAGHTAATFTYTERLAVERIPSVADVRAFLADYEAARGEPFDVPERRAAFAAAVYSRAYGARCAHAVGDLDRRTSRLEEYAAELL